MHYFLIPLYNEVPDLPDLAASLTGLVHPADKFFVFYDDGSTDETAELVSRLFQDTPYIILGDGSNHGPGYAFNAGFEWILSNSKDPSDKIITLEGDNTSDLGILPQMLAMADYGYQLVLASPYAQSGGFEKTTLLRKLVSFIANMMYRLVFDIKVLTLSSFYRVYTVDLLRSVKERYGSMITEPGFISKVEILIKALRLQASVIEIPMVLESSRRKGRSKMKVITTTLAYLRVLLFRRF